MQIQYLYPNQVLFIHHQILKATGGALGVRDQGLLESAVYRPQATFGGQDLYPDLFAKAAAMTCSQVKNHPFVDGNKRTAYMAMRLMLQLNGYDLRASDNEKFRLMVQIAEGKVKEEELTDWLKEHAHQEH